MSKLTKVEDVENLDLFDVKFEQPPPLPIPPVHGYKSHLISRLINTWVGRKFIIPNTMKTMKLDEFRNRYIPDPPMQYPQVEFDEPAMKSGERTEGLNEFYETVVKNSKTSKINRVRILYELNVEDSNQGCKPSEVIDKILEIIGDKTDVCNSVVQCNKDAIRAQALEADKRYGSKSARMLEGIPFLVKEEITVEGYKMKFGLPEIVTPPFGKEYSKANSLTVQRLVDEGAICIGISNMHQIGLGISGLNQSSEHFGGAKNPYDLDVHTGGSSSGTASGVASNLALFGLGTDGGGSIRIPAVNCGLVGIKPTFGRWSTAGEHWAGGSTVASGPLAQTVDDCAIVYAISAGYHKSDSNAIKQPVPRIISTKSDKTIKVGIWEDWINATEDTILLPFTKLINSLEKNDIIQTNKKFKIPEEFYMNTAHAGTIISEIYNDHKDLLFPENYEKINADTLVFLNLASQFTATDYVQFCRQKRRMVKIMQRVFEEFDVDYFITPTLGGLPKRRMPGDDKYMPNDLDYTLKTMLYVRIANFIGLPAMTVPMGMAEDEFGKELPFGVQIYGKWWDEAGMIDLARRIEPFVRDNVKRPEIFHNVFE